MSRSSSLRRVSAKCQVTVPAAWRNAHAVKPGDSVRVDIRGKAVVITPLAGILSLKGFLGKALPLEEERRAMEDAVARHVFGKD